MSALPCMTPTAQGSISIEDFERGDVDAEQFDHEAHVFVAWSYLQKYELKESIARFCAALRSLTIKLGVEGKYHETITWFFMILIAERKAGTKDWHTFKRRNADLFTNPSISRAYYSKERLSSSIARTQFVMPDLLPLP